jgi:hypothetical protein
VCGNDWHHHKTIAIANGFRQRDMSGAKRQGQTAEEEDEGKGGKEKELKAETEKERHRQDKEGSLHPMKNGFLFAMVSVFFLFLGVTRQDNHKTRHDKTRQDKARKERTRQNKDQRKARQAR